MPHDVSLISTIAFGLSFAFLFGLIASKLRLAPIIGYLAAGIMVGPYTPGFHADYAMAEQLSEIGIVLLMFGVGLHFSLKDLMEVKKIAFPGAVAQIAAATVLGVVAAQFWGWSLGTGIIFGLALSVASTVVLLRALEERNLVKTINGRIAIGWLIVEDIAMVLALVLIPAIATSLDKAGDGTSIAVGDWLPSLLVTLGKVGMFVAFMLVVGKRALPLLLTWVARTGSRELFTLSVFAVAVGVAFGSAELFGVSFALGAFFAGMMLKESELCHRVAENALPFQDAFAVLFFVSVGMLFDPMVLVDYPLHVLAVLAIIMVGKSVASFWIVIALRYPVNTALLVSAGLGQIGEFSFILASLGRAYGLLPPEAHSMILAGALLSITLNPLTFHAAPYIHNWVAKQGWAAKLLKISDDDLCHLTRKEKRQMRDTVIVAGYGLVGRHFIERAIEKGINVMVIDENREIVEELREKGISAIAADATHRDSWLEASLDKARAVVIAMPLPFAARQVAEVIRELHPNIEILVRAHNEEERDYFTTRNLKTAIMGEQEVANRMMGILTGAG